MAAIEKGVGSSDAVVKGWLAKAVTAKRSKRWICSNCDSQSEWEPVCKKCGEFSRSNGEKRDMKTSEEMIKVKYFL